MDDDDTTHRQALTDKLVRTLRLHQQQQALHRKAITDEILAAHNSRQMQFWEIYSGNANLATTMANKQRQQNRISFFEHPRYAQSWDTHTLQQFEGHDAHTDQCQYGATRLDHDGIEQHIRKPTRLRITPDPGRPL